MDVKEEITLRDLIFKVKAWRKYLLGKWVYILIIVLIGAVAGLTYSFFKKPVFTATTTFVLEAGESTGGLSQYAGLASMVGIDLGDRGGGIFQGDNIMELYKSRKMLEKTLLTPVVIEGKSQTLMERYVFFNEFKQKWKDKPELLALNFSNTYQKSPKQPYRVQRLRDSLLGEAVDEIKKQDLNVDKPDKKLSIIKIDVKSTDEQFSKLFNEQLVINVNQFYIQTKTKKSLDNVAILQHKVDSVRTIMNGAIYSAVAAIDATPNLNPGQQVRRTVPSQKAQFTAEANKAILANLIQTLELGKISLLKETPLIQTVDTPVYPLKKERFGKVKGLVLGGLLFGFLACLFFVLRRLYDLTINDATIS